MDVEGDDGSHAEGRGVAQVGGVGSTPDEGLQHAAAGYNLWHATQHRETPLRQQRQRCEEPRRERVKDNVLYVLRCLL
jgi:hypothetical protein